jgi:hypothetical protein
METTKWYLSKTLWTNFIMTVLIFAIPQIRPYVQNPEVLASAFMAVNFVLRLLTKGRIVIS